MSGVISKDNAEHYKWGDGADGWHLLKSDLLSVIEELVPPGVKEIRHYHQKAQQFFYVFSGTATLELDGKVFTILPGSGLHVPANTPHQLRNQDSSELRFLVISQPKSHGDRVDVSSVED